MSETSTQALACINCTREETEVPVTEWRLAGRSFWVCPDCLPQLIHHRSKVMSLWGLTTGPSSAERGA